eukprot:TRINITY_DN40172_c0_g1_i1.p1 TRINITY_DN40172_c0_g1~~TRINITY_DN40172_c0_g1_i1.p1  ORF type:complete len:483 (+),score=141.02 TRINITY_DN40172_c0_g1_i1:72-1520(+)
MAMAGLNEELAKQIRSSRPVRSRGKAKSHHTEASRHAMDSTGEASVESLLLARLQSCHPLLHALRVAVKQLQEAGHGLQRSTKSINADALYRQQLTDGELPVAIRSRGMIDAIGCIGAALTDAAKHLQDEVMDPLNGMYRSIREECIDRLRQVQQLEHQGTVCSQAVSESLLRKEKAAAELQAILQQEEKGGKRSKSGLRLEEAAAQQTAIVEDLAAKMDQAAALRVSRQESLASFKELLRQVDSRCASHLPIMTGHFSSAWATSAKEIQRAAEMLKGDPETPAPVSHAGSTMLAPSVAAAAKAPEPETLSCGGDNSVLYVPPKEVSHELAPPKQEVRERSPSPRQEPKEGVEPADIEFVVPGEEPQANEASARAPVRGVATPDGSKEPPAKQEPLVLHFGEHVKRLGFEVLWELERPSVGNVQPGGEAESAGLISGMVLTEINGTATLGRARDELMPLLKVRPLELVLDTGRKAPTAAAPG